MLYFQIPFFVSNVCAVLYHLIPTFFPPHLFLGFLLVMHQFKLFSPEADSDTSAKGF